MAAELKDLSHKHEAILHFMLANPLIKKGEVAERFGVSQPWLSIIINSQAFIEARAALTDQAFNETVLPLREKLIVLADQAVDRLTTLIPFETDSDKVRKTAESVLAAVGFGAPAPKTVNGQTNIQNNFYGNASPEVLRRAQQRIGVTHEGTRTTQLPPPGGQRPGEGQSLAIQDSDNSDDGNSSDLIRAAVPDGSSIRSSLRAGPDSPGDLAGDFGSEGRVGETQRELQQLGAGQEGSGEGSSNQGSSSSNLQHPEGSLPSIGEITRSSPRDIGRTEVRLHELDESGIPKPLL